MSDNPQTMIKHYNDLTRDEILSMQGRELDALVAEKVMGWTYKTEFDKLFKPSESISAAWEVVERLKFMKNHIDVFTSKNGKWGVEVSKEDAVYVREFAITAPEAICKAALLAVMGL